jgi:hypothetical protein
MFPPTPDQLATDAHVNGPTGITSPGAAWLMDIAAHRRGRAAAIGGSPPGRAGDPPGPLRHRGPAPRPRRSGRGPRPVVVSPCPGAGPRLRRRGGPVPCGPQPAGQADRRRRRPSGVRHAVRLELGLAVECSDGPGGTVRDVVIDAVRRRVTHVVVERRRHVAYLVPIETCPVGPYVSSTRRGPAGASARCRRRARNRSPRTSRDRRRVRRQRNQHQRRRHDIVTTRQNPSELADPRRLSVRAHETRWIGALLPVDTRSGVVAEVRPELRQREP